VRTNDAPQFRSTAVISFLRKISIIAWRAWAPKVSEVVTVRASMEAPLHPGTGAIALATTASSMNAWALRAEERTLRPGDSGLVAGLSEFPTRCSVPAIRDGERLVGERAVGGKGSERRSADSSPKFSAWRRPLIVSTTSPSAVRRMFSTGCDCAHLSNRRAGLPALNRKGLQSIKFCTVRTFRTCAETSP
jgi:hypothetical protein